MYLIGHIGPIVASRHMPNHGCSMPFSGVAQPDQYAGRNDILQDQGAGP